MATSGSFDYTVNKAEIIKNALIEARVIRDDQQVDGQMYAWGSHRLNTLIKHLQTKGLHLWKTVDIVLLLEKNKEIYTLSSVGDTASTDMEYTTLSSAASSATTSLSLSTTSITAGQNIGIELADGTIHWTTVTTVDSSTALTISLALTGAANSGAAVFTYTAKIPKPLRIYEAYIIVKGNETSHTPIHIIPRETYQRLNNKSSSGYPVEIYFRPDLDHSELKVYPTACDNTTRLVMSAELPLDDMDNSTDNLSFPNWWYEPIHLSLAHAMARSYGQTSDTVRRLKADAKEAVKEAEDYGVENTYIQLRPDLD